MGAHSLRLRALVLTWAVTIAAVAGVIGFWHDGWRVHMEPVAATLLLAVFVSEVLAVQLPGGASISLGSPLCVSSIALLGPVGAALAVVVSSIPLIVEDGRREPSKTLFNVSQVVVSVLVPSWLYFHTGGRLLVSKPLSPADFPNLIVPILLLTTTGAVTNLLIGGTGHALYRGISLRRVWRQSISWMAASQIAFGLVSVAIAQVMASSGPLGFILFVTPLVVARQFYQRYIALRDTYADTIRSLVAVIEAKDPYTKGHSVRVARYATAIAERLKMSDPDVERLEYAALLHDLGKIGVSHEVLGKCTSLTEPEHEEIRRHPHLGADILNSVEYLSDIIPVVESHHERIDGGGYGKGLAGEEIPMAARVLAVADSYDAMTSDRPYRPALSDELAVMELVGGRGTQFDPAVVDAFVECLQAGETESRPHVELSVMADA